MTIDTAKELQMNIAKEGLALLVLHPTADVQLHRECISHIGTAWDIPFGDTQEVISLIADKTGLHGDEEKLKGLAEQVISENLGQMVVTPKDIDSIVEDMSGIIATGINMALFGKSFEDVRMLIA